MLDVYVATDPRRVWFADMSLPVRRVGSVFSMFNCSSCAAGECLANLTWLRHASVSDRRAALVIAYSRCSVNMESSDCVTLLALYAMIGRCSSDINSALLAWTAIEVLHRGNQYQRDHECIRRLMPLAWLGFLDVSELSLTNGRYVTSVRKCK